MKIDELAKHYKHLEYSAVTSLPIGLTVAIRLDGRGFTKLTNAHFDKPFDSSFRDLMHETTRHLMDCGFRFMLGYTQSDEISLLLHPQDDCFARKSHKILSLLAAEASSKFSLLMGKPGIFDARLCPLPQPEDIPQYFRWRQEDADRNALNAHCYWILCKQGRTGREATLTLKSRSTSFKHELLYEEGVNFKDLPLWQKRGALFYWGEVEKKGQNPKTGETVSVLRRKLLASSDLPRGDAFNAHIQTLLTDWL